MRLASSIHIEWIDQEAVVLDEETGQLHYLNTSAALSLALVLEHGKEGALSALLRDQEDNSSITDEFTRVIDDLMQKNILTDAPNP